jgi:ABC-type glutathione transport system ATPase component
MLFERYDKRPFTVLLITHDYSVISEIAGRYRRLMPKIHFKDLNRDERGELVCRDFSADDYLAWLKQEAAVPRTAEAEGTVLRFGARFSVFGRKLMVTRDAAHREPVDLCIRRGETVYLKAQSGVGKTTLAKIIMGLYDAQDFTMDLGGLALTARSPGESWHRHIWGKKAGMVFQHADEALNLQATVAETFKGLSWKVPLSPEKLRALLATLFDAQAINAILHKKVTYLSGGQKQRLNLLRTLALDPDLCILDEPLNGLDFGSIRKVLAMLEEKRRKGAAFLLISHSEEIFDSFVDAGRVYYLSETSG